MQSETKICQSCKKEFTIEPEDFEFYAKIKVPPPTFCPECRLQRRMSWRNERSLYKRKCEAPGHTEEILSMYDPARGYHVYDIAYWWSDAWDPMEVGAAYDPTKTFLDQFSDLLKRAPLAAISMLNSVNSEYTNFVEYNKNCYLVFGSGLNEDVRYANKAMSCKDSQDLLMCTKCELSYECVGCIESSRLFYSRNSKSCTDSYFLENCRNCNECIGCTNLINKSYCIFNEQYSKEEYHAEKEKLNLKSRAGLGLVMEKFLQLCLASIHRHANIFNSQDCTGDNISHAKNCKNCFDIFQNLEDCKYMYSALEGSDSYDGNGMYKNTLSYECVDCDIGSKNLSGVTVYGAEDVQYSFNCHGCTDCFGCTGLRKKKYCILNTQYSPEEYASLTAQIISNMNERPYVDQKGRVHRYGDFFPTELSPFAYNETIVQEYFPLTAESAEERGFIWKTAESRDYKVSLRPEDLPDAIENTQDTILQETIACAHKGECGDQCTTAFRITPVELDFYRKLKIPLPQLCSNCRHYARIAQRNPLKLWDRTCMKCGKAIQTSYSPDRPEIVYCESCYQAEVV